MGVQGARQRVELADQQRPGAGHLRETCHAVGRGLGAVRGAEGVHDEDVAQRRHAFRQRLVVLLLTLVEAHVLGQRHLAIGEFHAVEPVGDQAHRTSEQAAQRRAHRGQRELRIGLTLGRSSEV
jgi:hypothetical protein